MVFSLLEADSEKKLQTNLVFYGVAPLLEEYKQRCEVMNIPYTVVQSKVNKPVRSWYRLFSYLLHREYEVIIMHSLTVLLPVAFAARIRGKKLIVVEHMANSLKTTFEKKCSALAMRFASKVVVLTDIYAAELRTLLHKNFRADKVEVIPNGINTNVFAPAIKRNESLFSFGMVGRFTASKDYETLIYAFKEIHSRHPQTRLQLAGDGETMLAIKQLVKALLLEDVVTFKGTIAEKGLIHFYQSLDVYMHISKGETMSTAIMQAMSCGIPVVASDISGIRNMLPTSCGILVANNIEAIKTAMEQIFMDEDLRLRCGVNARTYACEHFSYLKMLDRYMSLIF